LISVSIIPGGPQKRGQITLYLGKLELQQKGLLKRGKKVLLHTTIFITKYEKTPEDKRKVFNLFVKVIFA